MMLSSLLMMFSNGLVEGLAEIDDDVATANECEAQVVEFADICCDSHFGLIDSEGVDDVKFFAHDVSFRG